jgi:hypothetical protein
MSLNKSTVVRGISVNALFGVPRPTPRRGIFFSRTTHGETPFPASLHGSHPADLPFGSMGRRNNCNPWLYNKRFTADQQFFAGSGFLDPGSQ